MYYLDTSAIAKYYINERGSEWVRDLIDAQPQPIFLCSALVIAEMTSVLSRRHREGTLDREGLRQLQLAFQSDCSLKFQLQPVSLAVLDTAALLLQQHPLRTLDAIHLATALMTHSLLVASGEPILTFVCADERLNTIAKLEGIVVDNPTYHDS